MGTTVKLDSFYGGKLSRPYLVMGKDGKPLTDRVDKPSANAPLLEWAQKVPVEAGGALQKPPVYEGNVPKSRNEFAIFCEVQRGDIIAANPKLNVDRDEKGFKVAASLFYSEKLTEEDRRRYNRMAIAEAKAVEEAIEALKASDPKFLEFLKKEAAYKKAKSGIFNAQKMSSAPLWKVARSKSKATKEIKEEDSDISEAEIIPKKKSRKQPRVPEALKLKYEPRPTKKYEVRSKKHAAKRAEDDKNGNKQRKQQLAAIVAPEESGSRKTRAGIAASREKVEYTDEYALPDLLKEMRQTRSQAAAAAAEEEAPKPPAKKRNRRK